VVAVSGAVAGAGWVALTGTTGRSTPTTPVPAATAGYVSLDLDPTASQKIDAFQILRKFPALARRLDLGNGRGIRRWLEDEIAQGGCKGLDYDRDFKPWIGERIVVAAVPAERKGGEPLVMGALKVTDRNAAAAGLRKLNSCDTSGANAGFAFTGDYVVISDTTRHAQALARSAVVSSLAGDAAFWSWTAKGGAGMSTMHASARAPLLLADVERQPEQAWTAYALNGGLPASRADMMTSTAVHDMAGVSEFRDGRVEAEFAPGE
jgi:hypothetical protein